jgi:hypothetical protein
MSDRNRLILDQSLAGVSIRAIARNLGCSVGTVSGVLSRARKRGEYSPHEIVRGGEVVTSTMDRLARYNAGIEGCRWVVGEPGTPNWRWCGVEPIDSSPYCAAHQAMI